MINLITDFIIASLFDLAFNLMNCTIIRFFVDVATNLIVDLVEFVSFN